MWQIFLSLWNGVSVFLDDKIIVAADMHLFTDATENAFAGNYGDKWFQGEFPTGLLQQIGGVSMAVMELYPIVVACVLWSEHWSRKYILFHCDNMAKVQIINKG